MTTAVSHSTHPRRWTILSCSTVAFAVNFAVWTMFSVIGLKLKQELSLTEREFGLLVALPVLSGSLSRIPLGMLTERHGGRIIFFLQMLLVAVPTYALTVATTYEHYLGIGFLVGLAGGSFTIGITYTQHIFPQFEQDSAIGIFGAGNVGAAMTNILVPLIMINFGWRAVPQIYAAALLVVAVLFYFVTRDNIKPSIRQFSWDRQLKSLTHVRVWRFGLYYFFVFGGFVALALWLPHYIHEEYGLSIQQASFTTLFFVLPVCLLRASANVFSNRYSARQINWSSFWVCIVCLFFLSYPSTSMTIHGVNREIQIELHTNVYLFAFLLLVMGSAMGFAQAGVFRNIHKYYPNSMGLVGGLVAAMGGLGGFVLPVMFGIAVDITGIRSSCFMLLYGVLGACMIWMYYAIKVDEHLDRVRNAINSDFLKE